MIAKSLDQKLANILADSSCKDFILADAKDADMAFGLSAPGKSPEHHAHEGNFRSLDDYRRLIRDVVDQGLVDIMLMSASTSELLTIRQRLFDNSHITPAIRANDTSEIWLAGGEVQYANQPSRPFRTATLDHAMCGKAACEPEERTLGADLGLYSVTFNNDIQLDGDTLEAYKAFRIEAEQKNFRHFLELFDPNAPAVPVPNVGKFLNDHIARTLAGVTSKGRPIFLKIPYHGPEAMEALATYDPNLVPGILGGGAGTTYDAFFQLHDARKHGARAALYGRKINHSEHQLTFVRYLRALADDEIKPDEAVKAYHGDLQRLSIQPYRSLEEDMKLTVTATAYGGTKTAVAVDGGRPAPAAHSAAANISNNGHASVSNNGSDRPDFAAMSSADRIAYHRARLDRRFGR
ncbi:MAG: hypothetical protein WD294_08610 [Phycisphaeraceae bacterium]